MRVSDATIRSVCTAAYGVKKVDDIFLAGFKNFLEIRGIPRESIIAIRVTDPNIEIPPRGITLMAEVPEPGGSREHTITFTHGLAISVHVDVFRRLAPVDQGANG